MFSHFSFTRDLYSFIKMRSAMADIAGDRWGTSWKDFCGENRGGKGRLGKARRDFRLNSREAAGRGEKAMRESIFFVSFFSGLKEICCVRVLLAPFQGPFSLKIAN